MPWERKNEREKEGRIIEEKEEERRSREEKGDKKTKHRESGKLEGQVEHKIRKKRENNGKKRGSG